MEKKAASGGQTENSRRKGAKARCKLRSSESTPVARATSWPGSPQILTSMMHCFFTPLPPLPSLTGDSQKPFLQILYSPPSAFPNLFTYTHFYILASPSSTLHPEHLLPSIDCPLCAPHPRKTGRQTALPMGTRTAMAAMKAS
jgi:hypothetical protein